MSRPASGARLRALPFLLLALALLPAATAGLAPTLPVETRLPCSDGSADAAFCPDLMVDPRSIGEVFITDNQFAAGDCAVVEGLVEAGARRLMRFGVTTANVGSGDLSIGHPAERPDLFTWSDCHGHHHFDDYAAYRLWTLEGYAAWSALRAAAPGEPAQHVLDEHPDIAAQHVAGLKVGFCIIDVRPVVPHAIPQKYASCSNQGLSAGWADHYAWYLDGQWIDVTGVPTGHYVLEVEVNPARVLDEASYANNAAATTVYVWHEA